MPPSKDSWFKYLSPEAIAIWAFTFFFKFKTLILLILLMFLISRLFSFVEASLTIRTETSVFQLLACWSISFNNLVTDFRSLEIMKKTHYPVIFDATHSVQEPGGLGEKSGGKREFISTLSKAAVAIGVAGIFIETHNDPDNAPSDGPNMLNVKNLEILITKLIELDRIAKK